MPSPVGIKCISKDRGVVPHQETHSYIKIYTLQCHSLARFNVHGRTKILKKSNFLPQLFFRHTSDRSEGTAERKLNQLCNVIPSIMDVHERGMCGVLCNESRLAKKWITDKL